MQTGRMKRPITLVVAIDVLAVSFIFDVILEIRAAVAFFSNNAAYNVGTLIVPVGIFLVKFFLLYHAYHGRNWARIGLFMVITLGVAFVTLMLRGSFAFMLTDSIPTILVQIASEVVCFTLLVLADDYFSSENSKNPV